MPSDDADARSPLMQTIRTTLNLDARLIAEACARNPGLTRTAVLEEGLRALLARDAALRLAELGGTTGTSRRSRRKRQTKR